MPSIYSHSASVTPNFYNKIFHLLYNDAEQKALPGLEETVLGVCTQVFGVGVA